MFSNDIIRLHYDSCVFSQKAYFNGIISKELYYKYIENITEFILVGCVILIDDYEDFVELYDKIMNNKNFLKHYVA